MHFIQYGWSDGENGYIVFPDGKVFKFNPEAKTFIRIENYQSDCDRAEFSATGLNNIQYVFSNRNYYMYQYDGNRWNSSATPFFYGTYDSYHHCFCMSNQIYLLGGESYKYNIVSKQWQQILSINSIGGTELNGLVYLMEASKVLKRYNPLENTCQNLSTFPGSGTFIYSNRAIGFSYHNKICFGFIYSKENRSLFKDIWTYDLTTRLWRKIAQFPDDITNGNFFHFLIKGKLYIGHSLNSAYTLYSLDLSNLD